MNYVIVDIETTGGSPKSSKITEIAIYKHNGEEVIGEFVTLLNPEMVIPEFIVRLTGITNDMVKDKPRFFEVAKEIIEFTDGCIFVAHNVGFDYGIVRHEFRTLGFDYRRPHLCTVRASRYILPGMASYSLGKLSRSLGIEITDRHRAAGDALATVQLFNRLIEKDINNLQSFIQQEVNPRVLHPNLDLEIVDNLPGKTGVYIFYNAFNQIIYIGKSKQIKTRVEQHLRNLKTKKGTQMIAEITRIEYELTGTELIALLRESQLIKQHKPIYNHRLKKSKFPYGLFDYPDEKGYVRFFIALTEKTPQQPLASFSTKAEATGYLEKWCSTYELCQKLCDLYPTQSACFHHSIKQCYGACISEESVENYNERANQLVDKLTFNGECFYLLDKGRHKSEKSLVLVERGAILGFGFAPYHFQSLPQYKWKRFIDITTEDRDARAILAAHMRKYSDSTLIRF